jgi:hypothetical protein
MEVNNKNRQSSESKVAGRRLNDMKSISDSLFATIFRPAMRPKKTPTVRTGPFPSPRGKKAGEYSW